MSINLLSVVGSLPTGNNGISATSGPTATPAATIYANGGEVIPIRDFRHYNPFVYIDNNQSPSNDFVANAHLDIDGAGLLWTNLSTIPLTSFNQTGTAISWTQAQGTSGAISAWIKSGLCTLKDINRTSTDPNAVQNIDFGINIAGNRFIGIYTDPSGSVVMFVDPTITTLPYTHSPASIYQIDVQPEIYRFLVNGDVVYSQQLSTQFSATGGAIANTGVIPSNTATTWTAPAYVAGGSNSYTVTATFENGETVSQTIVVQTPSNDAIAANDSSVAVSGAVISGNAASNDTPNSTGTTSYALKPGTAVNCVPTVNANGTYSLTYTPGFVGTLSFEMNLLVNGVIHGPETITYVVSPSAVANDQTATTPKDTPKSGDLATGNTANNGGTTTYQLKAGTEVNGTATVNPNGTYVFTPTPGFAGTASFQYNQLVNGVVVATKTVTITVSAPPANYLTATIPVPNGTYRAVVKNSAGVKVGQSPTVTVSC